MWPASAAGGLAPAAYAERSAERFINYSERKGARVVVSAEPGRFLANRAVAPIDIQYWAAARIAAARVEDSTGLSLAFGTSACSDHNMQSGRWKKLAIAGAILIVGIGTALLFRREQPAVERTTAKALDTFPPPADSQVTQRMTKFEPALAGRIEPYSLHDTAVPAPDTAASFASATLDPTAQPGSPLKWQTVRRPDQPGAVATIETDRTPLDRLGEGPPTARELAPEKRHKIVDGDTLAALAQRYLGADGRSLELFEYNRDVLITPDVLPIGKELRIPPRDFAPAREAEVESQSHGLTALVQSALTTTKHDFADARPVTPPAAKAAAQTYVVQQHDTLALIARKLYGDISRQNDLMSANRAQLRSAKDLRPGMTLVVPAAPRRAE